MQKNKISYLVMALIVIASATQAGPLWLSGNDLYSAKGARDFRPGDIVTIVVSEESDARSQATTNTQKETQVQITSNPTIPLFKGAMDQFIGDNQVNNEFDGEGTTTRSGRLNATITSTVMEVLANGNLLLEGTRSIRINHETQLMRVKGVARPRDIDANNQINSKLLADGQIKFDGNGAVDRVNKPGVITQLINIVF